MQTIYALTSPFQVADSVIEPGIFYIGRTKDPVRRKNDHIRAALNPQHTEHKYQHIRALTEHSHTFELEIIVQMEDEDFHDHSEHYYMHQALQEGVTLTNMKPGDKEIYDRIPSDTSYEAFHQAWLDAEALIEKEAEARVKSEALRQAAAEQQSTLERLQANKIAREQVIGYDDEEFTTVQLWACLSVAQEGEVGAKIVALTERRSKEFTGKRGLDAKMEKWNAELERRALEFFINEHGIDPMVIHEDKLPRF